MIIKRNGNYFFFHFFFFSGFNLGDFFHGVDLDLGAHDFDLVLVHGRVGAHDFGVFHARGTPHRDGLFQDESVTQEGVSDASAGLLDYMNVVQIRIAF